MATTFDGIGPDGAKFQQILDDALHGGYDTKWRVLETGEWVEIIHAIALDKPTLNLFCEDDPEAYSDDITLVSCEMVDMGEQTDESSGIMYQKATFRFIDDQKKVITLKLMYIVPYEGAISTFKMRPHRRIFLYISSLWFSSLCGFGVSVSADFREKMQTVGRPSGGVFAF